MAFRNVISFYRNFGTRRNVDLNLNGIFVPLTTPFDENEQISFDKLKTNLDKYEEIPFTGYCVAGTNGEAPYLTAKERLSVVEFVRKNTKRVLIGGSTAESTKAACALTTDMMNAGADGVLIQPPFYFRTKMTDEALTNHFTTIAETCGSPIVVYNNPMVTGIDIPTSTLAKLAQHPLIRGVKDSDIRKCAVTVQETRGYNFDVLTGSAGYLLGALFNGSSGGILGLAGLLGTDVCNLYSLFKDGKIKEASEIQRNISKLDVMLLAEMGVAGLKTSMDMLGLAGGLCRKPILPLTEMDKSKIRKGLQEAGFL